MESCSLKPTHQFIGKGKRQEGQANRETRAFVAMHNRKMSRRSGIEKKRGLPLMEVSTNENEVHNCQEQRKKGIDRKATKHVDHLKQALRKWQKEKRLRQIQEKKTKKAPFRISQVSYRASEFPHSFQNEIVNDIRTTKIEQKDATKMAPPPKRAAQKNNAVTRKAKPSNSGRDQKTGTTSNKLLTSSGYSQRQRTMKTRSMVRTDFIKSSNSSLNTSVAVRMETNDISTSQITSSTQDLPGCVTRSRANETSEAVPAAASYIPDNFSFNAPAGVTSFVFCRDQFTFTPLSPNSAKKFFPTRSPLAELRNEKEQNCNDKIGASGQQEVFNFDMVSKAAAKTKDIGEKEINKPVLDATYFRNLANSEIDRLKSRCARLESESKQVEAMPEEVKGMIRTVIGQVQLLVTKKFKQFSGLLDLNEDPTAEKKALVSDLQGFWDMMYIQVEDIDKKFDELEQLKENNWEKKQPETKKKSVKRTTKGKKIIKTVNPKVAESRNKFREMRAQLKAKMQAEKNEDWNAFKIVLTPVKNKKADTDPSEPEVILTPVRRSTRKSRGCASIAVPLVNLPNVSVDLFGACKTPETVNPNECLSNLDDSMSLPRLPTSSPAHFPTSDDLMVFSPTSPAKKV